MTQFSVAPYTEDVGQSLLAGFAREAFIHALPIGTQKLSGWGELAKKITVHQFAAPGIFGGPDADGLLLVVQGGLRLQPDARGDRSCELFGFGDIANTMGHLVDLLGRARSAEDTQTTLVRTDTYLARKGTTIGVIPAAAYLALCQESAAWYKHLEELARTSVTRFEGRLHSFNYLTAEERMRQVMSTRPGLLSSFSQKELAEHLGVTPVAICRIAKRLRLSARAEPEAGARPGASVPGCQQGRKAG